MIRFTLDEYCCVSAVVEVSEGEPWHLAKETIGMVRDFINEMNSPRVVPPLPLSVEATPKMGSPT